MSNKPKTSIKPKLLLLDVDGVLTDGQFYYSAEGKLLKCFGPDDHDGICLLKPYLEIRFITGDKRGFDISKARVVDDMKLPLDLVSTIKRIDWIKERWNPSEVIYMGDGIFDHYVFKEVGYAIATADGDMNAQKNANYVTQRKGGKRAVAEACLHILSYFFEPYDPERMPNQQTTFSGLWGQ